MGTATGEEVIAHVRREKRKENGDAEELRNDNGSQGRGTRKKEEEGGSVAGMWGLSGNEKEERERKGGGMGQLHEKNMVG